MRLIFRPISEIQKFERGCFPMGGAIFNFSQKIGLKSTKNVRFCILHKPMGGGSSPPPPRPPGYATGCCKHLKHAIVHAQDVRRLDEWFNYCAHALLLFWFGSLGSNTIKDNNFFTISYRILEKRCMKLG